MFKKVRKIKYTDRVEERFQTIVNLIKDLEKKEFNRLVEGMTLAWESWNKVRQAKTKEEKENDDIDKIDEELYTNGG